MEDYQNGPRPTRTLYELAAAYLVGILSIATWEWETSLHKIMLLIRAFFPH